jgi:hypothetical protein
MFDYDYEVLLADACWPAVEGHCCLATGILEVKDGFNLLYGTSQSFEEVLQVFNKTEHEYIQDVVHWYKAIRRRIRG